jgi:hypothetical protein
VKLEAATTLTLAIILVGCGAPEPPPREMLYDGLPVQGSLATAHRLGFNKCLRVGSGVQCQAAGVRLKGQGPYRASVDLYYSDGSGGFYLLTLWHDRDQHAVSAVGDALEREGWTCVVRVRRIVAIRKSTPSQASGCASRSISAIGASAGSGCCPNWASRPVIAGPTTHARKRIYSAAGVDLSHICL